jgi:hypothetical protein
MNPTEGVEFGSHEVRRRSGGDDPVSLLLYAPGRHERGVQMIVRP